MKTSNKVILDNIKSKIQTNNEINCNKQKRYVTQSELRISTKHTCVPPSAARKEKHTI